MNSLLVGFDKSSNTSIFRNTSHIRVYKDDLSLFEARNNELKSAISFYKMQNEKYNLACKK